jgi:hypothetical protein
VHWISLSSGYIEKYFQCDIYRLEPIDLSLGCGIIREKEFVLSLLDTLLWLAQLNECAPENLSKEIVNNFKFPQVEHCNNTFKQVMSTLNTERLYEVRRSLSRVAGNGMWDFKLDKQLQDKEVHFQALKYCSFEWG